jgi:hypothetical protein
MVGRMLAARAANGGCIEGDALAGFIVSRMPGTVQQIDRRSLAGGGRCTPTAVAS